MNFIYLKGIIKNIQYSHTIDNIIFNKADLIVKRPNGEEDLIIIKYKAFSANFKEYSEVEFIGNIRSFSQNINGKNKVSIYVFSYFDNIEDIFDSSNIAILEGRICKKDILRQTSSGKHYIHYIVANNIITDNGQKINSYIPCVAWGKLAKDIDASYNVGDMVHIEGQLQSREYKKKIDDNNIELRVAHELATSDLSLI